MYIDWPKLLRGFLEIAKKQTDLTPGSLESNMLMMAMMSGMDLSDTAQTEKMLKYSGAQILTIATTSDGVRFTMVGLRPAEE